MLRAILGAPLPPVLALFATLCFIGALFWRDFRQKPKITRALWLPLLWMLIICSRSFSEWLKVFGFSLGGISLEEGSPLDACCYFALITAGVYVLTKRQVSLAEFGRNNPWLIAFLVYCLISVVWSDYPFVSFKRWIKILGQPIMVLVLFTEPDFEEALTRLMKRCAYVIVPVSILFIKYYPEYGRRFDQWSGQALNTGITTGKNQLGGDCLILGFFFFWHLLQTWHVENRKARRNELIFIAGFLLMIGWLLGMAHSSTSLMCLVVGVFTVVLLGFRFVNKRLIGAYVVLGVVVFLILEVTFGISSVIIEALGRDSTLTGRTELWKQLLDFHTNPIFGVGFESFWLGGNLEFFHEGRSWQPNEAHNGYLETYLNLGLIGVFLLIGWLGATFRKSRSEFLRNFEFGRFRLGLLAAIVLYNFAESGFKTLHPMWFIFYIISIDYPRSRYQSVAPLSEGWESEEEAKLAYVP